MRFVPQFLATLALGTVLGVIAAPVGPNTIAERDARPPEYADGPTYKKDKADLRDRCFGDEAYET
jgi:hypothetical protein